jgi:hypothetical protein
MAFAVVQFLVRSSSRVMAGDPVIDPASLTVPPRPPLLELPEEEPPSSEPDDVPPSSVDDPPLDPDDEALPVDPDDDPLPVEPEDEPPPVEPEDDPEDDPDPELLEVEPLVEPDEELPEDVAASGSPPPKGVSGVAPHPAPRTIPSAPASPVAAKILFLMIDRLTTNRAWRPGWKIAMRRDETDFSGTSRRRLATPPLRVSVTLFRSVLRRDAWKLARRWRVPRVTVDDRDEQARRIRRSGLLVSTPSNESRVRCERAFAGPAKRLARMGARAAGGVHQTGNIGDHFGRLLPWST